MLRGDRHLASTAQMDLGTVESRFQGTDGEKNSEYALPKDYYRKMKRGSKMRKVTIPKALKLHRKAAVTSSTTGGDQKK